MKALVTRATGFIGSAVTRALLDSGVHVRVILCHGSNLKNLEGLDGEYVYGNLLLTRIPVAKYRMLYDCSKALRELNIPQTPVETSLEKSVRWFQHNGYA